MLLSETHLTNKYNFQLRGYSFYATNHPDGKAHGGTGHPRFTIAEDEFMQFFNSLGDYFIAAGDNNAKHTHW